MLYHYLSGFPRDFRPPTGTLLLTYTRHAARAARDDRYGDLTRFLPDSIRPQLARLVELRTDDHGAVARLVYRMNVSPTLDLVVALAPHGRRWNVTTVWANTAEDTHRSLDRRRYAAVA